MPYLRETAIILSSETTREQDAWVTVYGRTRGKMQALARGVRQNNAKQLGHLEPYQTAEVMIAKGREYDKLAVARVTVPRLSLRNTLPGLTLARACVDLTKELSRPDEAQPDFFPMLDDALALAERLPDGTGALRVRFLIACYGWQLLRTSGFVPPLDRCIRCQNPLNDQAGPEPNGEGWLCASCAVTERSISFFPPMTTRLLAFAGSQPLSRVAGVTAPIAVLDAAATWMASMFRHAPLAEEPAALRLADAWLLPGSGPFIHRKTIPYPS